MMDDHHHHHQEISEIDLGNPHHHHGESLVEAPMIDHRKMGLPAFLEDHSHHHQFTQHLQQLQHQNHEQHMEPKKKRAKQPKLTLEQQQQQLQQLQHQHHQQLSGSSQSNDVNKRRGRPNIPIGAHTNPSVKYRRISDQVDKITGEENFLKKMINSEWGKKEYFETHALWHSRIIQNIAFSLKNLPNNSPMRKQIINLIGDDVPAAVLARVLEVSEKTIYRSRRLDTNRGPVSPPANSEKKNKDIGLSLDFPNVDVEEPVAIQSVVVNHGQDSDGNEGVHEVMSQNLNSNGLAAYENTNFTE
eukprot:TRINITY_DN9028_c0_g1_i1.p1 TRINITY_DN9028_c0_g1~~TRINITY_DN9028_c0_g1_i1.p1  ORF type:complete len:302 (+),score=70.60 TRINITY_DN9028_c0_g1_i1:168-1073(+)